MGPPHRSTRRSLLQQIFTCLMAREARAQGSGKNYACNDMGKGKCGGGDMELTLPPLYQVDPQAFGIPVFCHPWARAFRVSLFLHLHIKEIPCRLVSYPFMSCVGTRLGSEVWSPDGRMESLPCRLDCRIVAEICYQGLCLFHAY